MVSLAQQYILSNRTWAYRSKKKSNEVGSTKQQGNWDDAESEKGPERIWCIIVFPPH